MPALNTLIFFNVKDPDTPLTPPLPREEKREGAYLGGWQKPLRYTSTPQKEAQTDQAAKARYPTTSFLTATTLIYAIGAGVTAAAGTSLALQWILVKGFELYSFQLRVSETPALLFLVTTSLCQDWVICAPAAFLRCGSHFSGSHSGIEP